MAEFKCKKFTEAEINSLPKQIREFYDELFELSNGFASFYLKADEIAEQDKILFNIISKNLSEKKTEAPKKENDFECDSECDSPSKSENVSIYFHDFENFVQKSSEFRNKSFDKEPLELQNKGIYYKAQFLNTPFLLFIEGKKYAQAYDVKNKTLSDLFKHFDKVLESGKKGVYYPYRLDKENSNVHQHNAYYQDGQYTNKYFIAFMAGANFSLPKPKTETKEPPKSEKQAITSPKMEKKPQGSVSYVNKFGYRCIYHKRSLVDISANTYYIAKTIKFSGREDKPYQIQGLFYKGKWYEDTYYLTEDLYQFLWKNMPKSWDYKLKKQANAKTKEAGAKSEKQTQKENFVPKSRGKKKEPKTETATPKSEATATKKKQATPKEAQIVKAFSTMVGKYKTKKEFLALAERAQKANNKQSTERLEYITSALFNFIKDRFTGKDESEVDVFRLGKVGKKLFPSFTLSGTRKK